MSATIAEPSNDDLSRAPGMHEDGNLRLRGQMVITCEEAERRLAAELPPGCVVDVNDDMEIDADVFGRQVDVTLPDEPASPHEWAVIYQPTGEDGQPWVPTLCVGSYLDDIDDFPPASDDDGCPDPRLVGRVVRQLIHDRQSELVSLGYLDAQPRPSE